MKTLSALLQSGESMTQFLSPGSAIDHAIYMNALEAAPPVMRCGDTFCKGEAYDSQPGTGEPRYLTFSKRNGHCVYAGIYTIAGASRIATANNPANTI